MPVSPDAEPARHERAEPSNTVPRLSAPIDPGTRAADQSVADPGSSGVPAKRARGKWQIPSPLASLASVTAQETDRAGGSPGLNRCDDSARNRSRDLSPDGRAAMAPPAAARGDLGRLL